MAGVVKNMMVRVGADFSGLFGSFQKANQETKKEFENLGKSISSGTGLSRAMKSISKDAKAELDKVQKDISHLTDYSAALRTQLSGALKGSAEESGIQKELKQVEKTLTNLQGRKAVLGVQLDMGQTQEAEAQLQKTEVQVRSVNTVASDLARGGLAAIKTGWHAAGAAARGAWSLMQAGGRAVSGLIRPLANGIKSMGQGLKQVAANALGFGLVSTVMNQMNSAISSAISENTQLKAQTEQLKSAMASALAPAIGVVTNALSALMPYIVGVSNAIGQLVSNIFGSGWSTVEEGANKAATATGAAAEAQKEYNRQLAGFDEITKLSSQDSASGGGGGGGSNAVTNPIEGKTPGWLTGIADAVKKSIDADDWSIVGSAIAGQLDKILEKADTWLDSTDFSGIGKGLAQGINGAIQTWRESDTSIGQTLAKAINGLFNSVTSFSEELDWGETSRWLVGEVWDFISNIDWAKGFEGLGALTGGLAAAIGQPIVDGIIGIKDYFANEIDEAGGNVALGIWNGIKKGFTGAVTWIKENIFSPFIDGFKKAFSIHSPAADPTLLDAAKNVALGILDGIAAPFKAIGTWCKEHILNPIVNFFKGEDAKAEFKVEPDTSETEKTNWWTKFREGWNDKAKNALIRPKAVSVNIADERTTWWTSFVNWWNDRLANGTTRPKRVNVNIADERTTWWTSFVNWWNDRLANGTTRPKRASVNIADERTTWWTNFVGWWNDRLANGTAKPDKVSVGIQDGSWTWWDNFKTWWGEKASGVGDRPKSVGVSISDGSYGWWGTFKYWWNQASGKTYDRPNNVGVAIEDESDSWWESVKNWWNNRTSGHTLKANVSVSNVGYSDAGLYGASASAYTAAAAAPAAGQTIQIPISLILDGSVVGKASVQYINGVAATTGINPLTAYL